MEPEHHFDCAIIGGGLAGLSLAIQLSRASFTVALFEKEMYPFHKVCGEYISMESWDYLAALGLPLKDMNLPIINKLVLSAPNGNKLERNLDQGGFGISRYKIDACLKEIAIAAGVKVFEHCKVDDVTFEKNMFYLHTSKGNFKGRVCCGSFGKKSNLDVKWKRSFVGKTSGKLNNFIAIKYHVHSNFAVDTIALHNFKDGYCGISKIEDDRYCLCYLTNAANLKMCNNSIEEMEKRILFRNPQLREIFENSKKIYSTPLSISQISFERKNAIENKILMIGDSAGLITPLCGNGMSMAMHAAKIACSYISLQLKNEISREQMETGYAHEWKKVFANRIRRGRIIQRFFGKMWVTNAFISVMKRIPFIADLVIRSTHGKPF